MSPVLEADRDVAIGVHVVMMVAFAITATRAATRIPIAARAGRRREQRGTGDTGDTHAGGKSMLSGWSAMFFRPPDSDPVPPYL